MLFRSVFWFLGRSVGTHRSGLQTRRQCGSDSRDNLDDMRSNLLNSGNGSETNFDNLETVLLDPVPGLLEPFLHRAASGLESLPHLVPSSLESLSYPIASSLEPLFDFSAGILETLFDFASKIAESVSDFVEESRIEGNRFVRIIGLDNNVISCEVSRGSFKRTVETVVRGRVATVVRCKDSSLTHWIDFAGNCIVWRGDIELFQYQHKYSNDERARTNLAVDTRAVNGTQVTRLVNSASIKTQTRPARGIFLQ